MSNGVHVGSLFCVTKDRVVPWKNLGETAESSGVASSKDVFMCLDVVNVASRRYHQNKHISIYYKSLSAKYGVVYISVAYTKVVVHANRKTFHS